MQFNLNTGIEYKDDELYSPLNETETYLNLPKIEDEYPVAIELIGKSTKATNGCNTAKDFRHNYDNKTGKLEIVAENKPDENGNIYSDKIDGAKDEYIIICYYSSGCYNNTNVERNLEISGYVQVKIANENETIKKTDIKQNYTVTENIQDLVSTTLKTKDIYNGYINSNHENETKYRTEYAENLRIDISKKEIADEMLIDTQNTFLNQNEEEITTNDIIYKSTKISKNQVLSILGENGYLQILNDNGDILRRSK